LQNQSYYLYIKLKPTLKKIEIIHSNEVKPKRVPVINQGSVYETGMDLRDYFAGLAMQTYIQDHLQHKRENKMDGQLIE
jgi:hypothetical protein